MNHDLILKSKYIDESAKMLNPYRRDLEPQAGDRGFCMGYAEKSTFDPITRAFTAIVSSATVDRYEEIVLPSAFRELLPRFMSNPKMLSNHMHGNDDAEPTDIGEWDEVAIASDKKPVIARGHLLPAGDELTDKWAFRFEHCKTIAFSVGFIVHEWAWKEFPSPADPNVNLRLRVFTKVELIEISAVMVPANYDALLRAAGLAERSPDLLDAIERSLGLTESKMTTGVSFRSADPAASLSQIEKLLDAKFAAHAERMERRMAEMEKQMDFDPEHPMGASFVRAIEALGLAGHEADEAPQHSLAYGARTAEDVARELGALNAKLRKRV